MRKFQSAACVWMVMVVVLMITATGQSGVRSGDNKRARGDDGSQVVVNKDEFFGATTIRLRPQKLIDSPNHQLTMSAEVKLEGKTYAGVTGVDETVLLEFVSRSKERVDFGDEELHFLVDGKPVKGGPTAGGMYDPNLPNDGLSSAFKGGTSYTGGVSLSRLQQIVQGTNIAMRFGSLKLTLDEKILSNLREFFRATNSK